MNICVYCGSSTGANPVYGEAAYQFGRALAAQGFSLVYGGGNVGLMGIVADAVMIEGGKVIGIIPEFLLKREVGHRGITELEIVQSMHERKKRMAELADAFVALPGGWGTLEELAEVLTWRQLHLINEPVIILNINHFFDPLLAQLEHMSVEGFLKPDYTRILRVENSIDDLVQYLSSLRGS